MKSFWLFLTLFPLIAAGQILQYSPNKKLEKTVAATYYNTEYIFIKNTSKINIDLQFKVIENTLKPEWSTTICTNLNCFNTIPNTGSLGTISDESEAFFAFNFAANETLGQGKVRLLITSLQLPELKDTVAFEYTVTEDGSVKAGPWAKINYAQEILTVILENPNIKTTMQVINLEGKLIFDSKLGHITSIPLRDYPKGMYLVIVSDENERISRTKVVHY